MNLSIEVRLLAGLLLMTTILLTGTTTLYFSAISDNQQQTFAFNETLNQIEFYCDLNFIEINELIRQKELLDLELDLNKVGKLV
jgi:hypothetical protein